MSAGTRWSRDARCARSSTSGRRVRCSTSGTVVLVALLVAVLTGCNDLEGTGDKGYITQDGSLETVTAADRGGALTFQGEDLDGNPLSLEDFRGQPLVVVVWGSWCSPCRKEAPDVLAAATELEGTAQFVGLNIRDASPAAPQAFVRTAGITYPSFFSPGGEALLAFPGVLGPRTIPAFVVLDDQGRVAASILGSLPSTQTLVDVTRDVADETADG